MDLAKDTINDAKNAVSQEIAQGDAAVKDIIDHAFLQLRSILDGYKVTVTFEKVK